MLAILLLWVQDLCDRLWDICDKRKEEWEVERDRIWNEKWLEDHLGLLTNTYLSLMQVYSHTHTEVCSWRVCDISLGCRQSW